MVNEYHKKIQSVLVKLCAKNKDRFRKGYAGNRKIDINHPTKKRMSIIYYPDFVIISKNGNYYVFQILDSQENTKAYTIANVIESYLSEQVKKLFFIVKSERAKREVSEISETLLAKIADISDRNSIRNQLNIFYIIIPKNEPEGTTLKALEEVITKTSRDVEQDINKIEENS